MSALSAAAYAGLAVLPPLPTALNKLRRTLLIIGLVAGTLLFADTMRNPADQLTGGAYIGLVHIYQSVGRPLLEGIVACRFHPTCSDYSIQAVARYGIWRGLYLTAERLASCTGDVPMGTADPLV